MKGVDRNTMGISMEGSGWSIEHIRMITKLSGSSEKEC